MSIVTWLMLMAILFRESMSWIILRQIIKHPILQPIPPIIQHQTPIQTQTQIQLEVQIQQLILHQQELLLLLLLLQRRLLQLLLLLLVLLLQHLLQLLLLLPIKILKIQVQPPQHILKVQLQLHHLSHLPLPFLKLIKLLQLKPKLMLFNLLIYHKLLGQNLSWDPMGPKLNQKILPNKMFQFNNHSHLLLKINRIYSYFWRRNDNFLKKQRMDTKFCRFLTKPFHLSHRSITK